MKIPSRLETKLDQAQLAFFEAFFQNCPQTLIDHIIYKAYPPDHTLMYTDDSCSFVYILLSGRIQAMEEKAAEFAYRFTEIPAIEILGDYELFTDIANRIVTLTTSEPSTCLIIPSVDYFAWIKKDAAALFIRTQMLIKQLSMQTRLERQLLFMDNGCRMLHLLSDEYSRQEQPQLILPYTRAQIASRLGCSVRTVNRAVLQLQTEGAVSLVRGKIQISEGQFEIIQERIRQSE